MLLSRCTSIQRVGTAVRARDGLRSLHVGVLSSEPRNTPEEAAQQRDAQVWKQVNGGPETQLCLRQNPDQTPGVYIPVRLRSVATQAPTSGEETAAPGGQRPERAVPPKTGRGSGSAGSSREDGSERPLPTGSQLDAHRPRTRALLGSPGRPPGPDPNACATRSARAPCSRTPLGRLPPSARPPAVGPGSARAEPGPQPGRPLVRASFQNAKREAPKRPRPCLRARSADASEPRLPRETAFQASAASPAPAAPGEPSASTHRDAGAPSCVRASRRRVTAGKPHFPEGLAWPHRRREPLPFPWEPRPSGSPPLDC